MINSKVRLIPLNRSTKSTLLNQGFVWKVADIKTSVIALKGQPGLLLQSNSHWRWIELDGGKNFRILFIRGK